MGALSREHKLQIAVRQEQAEIRRAVLKGPRPIAVDEGDRLTVLIIFAQTKSVSQAALDTGVEYDRAKDWVEQAQLDGGLEDIYSALRMARHKQIEGLVDLTTVELRDRLVNGDTIVVDGALRLAPIKARDLSAIRKDLVEELNSLGAKVGVKTQQDTRLLAIAQELQGYIEAKVEQELATPTVDVSKLLEDDDGSEK